MEEGQSFSSWLKQRRRELGLSQEALAERVGCSVDMVRKVEASTARPSRQLAELMAATLQIAPQERPAFVRLARSTEVRQGREGQRGQDGQIAPPARSSLDGAITPPPTASAPTGTVTFLFTDIEGSTGRWEENPRAMQTAIALHNALLRHAIEGNGGYVFKTVGDAFCSAFTTAPQALNAALTGQRLLRAAHWSPAGPIRVRMALHTGDAQYQHGDYFGLPLNQVARLLSTGHGGQILLSLATQQSVRDTLPSDVDLRDLGEGGLRDLVYAEHVYQVLAPDLPSEFPLLKSLDIQHAEPTEAVAHEHNPYKGLRAFQEADAPDFFGREALTQRLRERLGEETEFSRFLAVVGPSGAGKSSVVRAGLVPMLRHKALSEGIQLVIIDLIPGVHPFEELEAALLRIAVNPPSSLMEQLRADERGLARAVKRVLPAGDLNQMLLVIDQFEELFTVVEDEAVRADFIDSLFSVVADPRSRLRVVITLRADFYDRPLLYQPSSELLGRRTEVVGPLTSDEMHMAITGPAQRAGLEFEQGLVAVIMQDVAEQPGALPLLQYTLTELYERRQGHLLTQAAYRASGGVFGSLASRAESLYAELTQEQQAEARQLFLRLVTLGEGVEDTRRRALLAEVHSAALDLPALRRVLEQFGRYRMVTFDRDPLTGGPTVEVAHEALLRNWGRLRDWLSSSRERLQVQRRLLSSARDWQASGQETSFLASGARLAQFEGLAAEAGQAEAVALTGEEQAYLSASLEEQRRREVVEQERVERELALQKRAANRLRYLATALIIFLGVASGLAAWALNRSEAAQVEEQVAQTNLAHSEAARLGTEANSLLQSHGDSQLIALLSIRSMDLSYSLQGEEALDAATRLDFPVRLFTGHMGPVLAVVFSPDGKYIATAGADHTARIWDVSASTGSRFDVASTRELRAFRGHTAEVTGVAFTPDGKYLLTASGDKTAVLWDVATGQPVRAFSGSNNGIAALALSPDGKYLATTDGSKAQLWDVGTGAQVHSLTGPVLGITSLAYSPDGKYLLAGSLDGKAQLWDAATGQPVYQLSAGDQVTAVAYSPDGKYLATGSDDRAIRIWDAATGNQLRALPGPGGGPDALAFTRDSKYLLSGEDQQPVTRLLDITTGQTLHLYQGQTAAIHGLAVSPDGKWLATASWDTSTGLWPVLTTPREAQFTGHTGAVWRAVMSPDGNEVLTASADKTARLWNANTGESIISFNGHTDEVRDAAFSKDGKYVGTASRDGIARFWDAATAEVVRRLTGHTGPVNGIAFAPDGKYVATAGSDGTARVWDAATGSVLVTFSGHAPQYVNQVVFSPDGRTVASTSDDKTARIWDATTGKQLMVFEGHTDFVYGVTFSPDGKYLLTGSFDGTARLWDVSNGKELRRFIGHTGPVYGVAFSPDGKYVATSGADRTARLWDARSGQELRRFSGHGDEVRSIAFSPDGRYLLTGSHDQSARLWSIDYHDTVRDFCQQLTRDLTPDERAQYGITDQDPTCPSE